VNKTDGLFSGRILALARCGLLLQMELRGLSVCQSVMIVSPAKTAEPIKMLFEVWTQVGTRNHVLDGGSDAVVKGQFQGGKGALTPSCHSRKQLMATCNF